MVNCKFSPQADCYTSGLPPTMNPPAGETTEQGGKKLEEESPRDMRRDLAYTGEVTAGGGRTMLSVPRSRIPASEALPLSPRGKHFLVLQQELIWRSSRRLTPLHAGYHDLRRRHASFSRRQRECVPSAGSAWNRAIRPLPTTLYGRSCVPCSPRQQKAQQTQTSP